MTIPERTFLSPGNNTKKNKNYRTDGGPNTEDKVFLLSFEEVERYLPTKESRKSSPTRYAFKQSGNRDRGFWQLRTPGKTAFGTICWGPIAISDYSGDYTMSGNYVGRNYIRPAIWIKKVFSED